MSPTKRTFIAFGFISVLLATAVVYATQSLKGEEQEINDATVTIAVSRTPLSAPFLVAEKLGFFKQQGLNVSLIPCDGGVACTKMMIDGEVEYATASESVVMFQSFKHNDVALLVSFVETDNDLKLLTLEPSNINSVADLDSKRVGVVKGSASEFYFDSVLIANNLKNLNIEKVYLSPQEMVPALLSYQVDAISAWEPLGYKADTLSAAKVINLGNHGIYQLSFNLLSVTEHLEMSGEEPIKLIRALDSAVEWINQNPNQALEMIAKQLNLSVSQVEWSWEDLMFRLALGNSLLSNIQLQARWAIERGLVDDALPDFRKVFYSEPYRQVRVTRD